MQRRKDNFETPKLPQSAAVNPRLAFESQSKTLRVCRNAAQKIASPRLCAFALKMS
jgi:hypothetical protein